MLLLRVELKTSRLLNGCSNQLSYKSACFTPHLAVTGTQDLAVKLANIYRRGSEGEKRDVYLACLVIGMNMRGLKRKGMKRK